MDTSKMWEIFTKLTNPITCGTLSLDWTKVLFIVERDEDKRTVKNQCV